MKLIRARTSSREYEKQASRGVQIGPIRFPIRGGRTLMNNPRRRLIGTVAVVCALGAAELLAPPIADAQAVGPAASIGLGSCTPSAVSQPFARWLDFAHYELVPGGAFESSSWSLERGAARVAGSEPYAATGTLGLYSLSLPAGSVARSPLTCVNATYPSMRFFIWGSGSVAVSVMAGSTVIPAGVAVAGGSWAPTPVMLTNAAVLSAASGGSAQVTVVLTGLSGNPRVDDVFMDPWSRG
jgi:hypothetical protein